MNKVISREYVEKNYIHKNEDMTDKYINMIEAFECDFDLAEEDYTKIDWLKNLLMVKDSKLIKDIDLLKELSFNLRHGKVKIINVEETKDANK